MTNRLLASPTAFKLSKAGNDVLAATGTALLFDGDMGSPAKFITGSTAQSRNGSGTTSFSLFFGKTFSIQPFVMVNVLAGTGTSRPGETYGIKGFGDSSTIWSDFALSWTFFQVNVLTDRVNFSLFYPGSQNFNFTTSYLVFDYRIGF